MNADIVWPDVERRGLVNVTMTRKDLLALLAGDNARAGGGGLVTVNDDIVVVVAVEG